MTKEADQFGRTTVINEKKSYNNISFKTEFTYKGVAGNSNRKTDLINTFKQSYDNNILANLFYKYDANNNITEVKSNSNNSTMYAYSYNSRDELHSFTDYINRDYYTYTYDEAGNILSKNHQNLNEGNAPVGTVTTTSYEYNNSEWQDLLTKYGNDSITYDTIGNPLNYRSGMTMTWSGRDLTSISKSGETYSYTYNINGYRTKKVANGDTYYYYYDSDNKLIGMQSQGHTYVFYYDNEDKIHSMEEDGVYYYYFVKNAEGDVIAITNNHGVPIVKYTYDAWGKTMSVKDNNGQDILSTSYYAKTIPFRFRGYAYDNESGLYYLNSRYYDPETGRFINADSYVDTESGTPISTNMFAYCENNPVMGYDPEGTWDRSVHRNLSKGSKYYKKSYRLSVEWNYNTDYFPLKSDEKVSAPFHSRKNSLKIAKKLYNLSMKVLKTKLLCRFGFIDNRSDNFFPNNDTILPLFLKYKTNSSGNQLNTHSTEHDFLNIINLKTTNVKVNYKNQSLVLLGLALHTIQDYFAHVIPICAKAYNKKGKEIHYSICESMTAFNHELKGVSTIDIEDNTEFIKWRFKETKKITNSMYKFFKKRLYIKKIKKTLGNMSQGEIKARLTKKDKYGKIRKHQGKYLWSVKTRRVYVKLCK